MRYVFGVLALIIAGLDCWITYIGITKFDWWLIITGFIFATIFGTISIIRMVILDRKEK